MSSVNGKGGNRFPNIPRAALDLYGGLSKADLAEALWDTASLRNPTSCDDEGETLSSFVMALGQGARKRALAYAKRVQSNRAIRAGVGPL